MIAAAVSREPGLAADADGVLWWCENDSTVGGCDANGATRSERPFLGGCNDESTSDILAIYPEVADVYKNIAFFLSSGRSDKVASPRAMRRVAKRMEKAGVKKVHLSLYNGAHFLNTHELDAALEWFLPTGSPVNTVP